MKIDEYNKALASVLLREVSFGLTTIYLFSEAQLEDEQIGYSVDPDGNSLVGKNEGDWQQNWFVIGYEDLCGDPIFINLDIEGFPVLTAAHGIGYWNGQEIANSFSGFVKGLEIISEISENRNTGVLLDQNPLSSKEKREALEKIRKYNPNSVMDFWEDLLGMEICEANLPANHKPKLPG